VKRKRPWWLTWLPAAVLVLIIIGVISASVVLRSNGLGDPAPAPTTGQVTDLNWSSFTPEGLAYIETSRDVRIDLSDGPPDAAPLGLDDDATLTIGPSENLDTDNDYYLIVNGGGEGFGGHKFTVSELSIGAADGQLESIEATQSGYPAFREVLNQLRLEVDDFGWAEPDIDALFDDVEVATRDGVPYEFTFGPGSRLGINVTATARCGTDGFCVLTYLVTPVVR
jgi:hypothetical protein